MCAKFYKNWLSFVEDITKTILVCFYGTQCRSIFQPKMHEISFTLPGPAEGA